MTCPRCIKGRLLGGECVNCGWEGPTRDASTLIDVVPRKRAPNALSCTRCGHARSSHQRRSQCRYCGCEGFQELAEEAA